MTRGWSRIPIDEMEIPVRICNFLKKSPYATAGELCDASDQDLLRVRGIGKDALVRIREALAFLIDAAYRQSSREKATREKPRIDRGEFDFSAAEDRDEAAHLLRCQAIYLGQIASLTADDAAPRLRTESATFAAIADAIDRLS